MLIQVIVGTTRQGRFSAKALEWVSDYLSRCPDIETDVVDLQSFDLPFFDQRPPVYTPRKYESLKIARFGRAVDRADGFLVLTGEYNHGYPGVLKNAMDHTFVEWARKPISFVGWGNVGAARAIEQLRQVAVEFEMAPLRHAVHILPDLLVPAIQSNPFDVSLLAPLDPKLKLLVDDLVWWCKALAAARAGSD